MVDVIDDIRNGAPESTDRIKLWSGKGFLTEIEVLHPTLDTISLGRDLIAGAIEAKPVAVICTCDIVLPCPIVVVSRKAHFGLHIRRLGKALEPDRTAFNI